MSVVPGIGGVLPRMGSAPACPAAPAPAPPAPAPPPAPLPTELLPTPKFPLEELFVPYNRGGRV